MKLPFKKQTTAYFAVTLLAAGIFFSLTNPVQIASLWLVLGFGLMVGVLYWMVRFAVGLLSFYSKHIAGQRHRLVRLGTLLGALLIALQSAGQLTVRDIAVLVPLAILSYLYVSYGRRPAPNR